ncbi:MAG: universal stress protein [Longimicrobiales bacterium]
MPQRRRILLAVRIGEASAGPAQTAAWLAAELDAELAVVYVATELDTAGEVASTMGMDDHAAREQLLEQARERADLVAREQLGGRPFELVIEAGDVAERVAAVAASLAADLIVAGSHAHGALRGAILGDTTADILRRAPCAVVVVPPKAART